MTSLQETQDHKVTVVMIPLLAHGHLNQLLHLSRVISSYNIPVHFVSTTAHNRQAKLRVHGWNPLATSNFWFHDLPDGDAAPSHETHDPPTNRNAVIASEVVALLKASIKLREPIYKRLRQLASTTRRLVVIYDFAMTCAVQGVNLILNAECYSFHCSSAFTAHSLRWELGGKLSLAEPEQQPEPVEDIPSEIERGCLAEMEEYTTLLQASKSNNSGYLYNTCRVIEGPYLDLLTKASTTDAEKHWALGPFNPVVIMNNGQEARHYSLEWLDKQAEKSVIYISFGTSISVSDEEVKEIAIGLEKSGQKFIWVLRDADKVVKFDGEVRRPVGAPQLPEGFEERTEGRGIVVRDWAPQLEILGHPSTGGFMSHCGWNSCMESITMGVPIAAWPVHSDQPTNGILLEKVLKIALVIRDWSCQHEPVTSITIEGVVRRLMDSAEGEEMRQRAKELSKRVTESIMEGGDSRLEMDSFIAHIRR